jgi:capsular exopolysaccharide synthesis family protein
VSAVPQGPRPPDAGNTLREYVSAIWKRRTSILALVLLGTAAGWLLGWRTENVYEVTTRVDIAKPRPFAPVTPSFSGGEAYVESQLYYPTRWALLGSPTYVDALLRETRTGGVREFPMWDWLTWPAYGEAPPAVSLERDLGPPLVDPELVHPGSERALGVAAFERLAGVSVATFRERFAFSEYGPAGLRRPDAPFRHPGDLRRHLVDRVSVRPEKGTTLVDIDLEGERKEVLAPLLNLLIDVFAREQRSETQRRIDKERRFWQSQRAKLVGTPADLGSASPDAGLLSAAEKELEAWRLAHATDANQLDLWKSLLGQAVRDGDVKLREVSERIAAARADVEVLVAGALPTAQDGGHERGNRWDADDAADRALVAALRSVAVDLDKVAASSAAQESRFHRLPFVLSDARVAELSKEISGAERTGSTGRLPELRAQRNALVREIVQRPLHAAVKDLELRLALRDRQRRDRAELAERWKESAELAARQSDVDRWRRELARLDELLQKNDDQQAVEKDVKPLKVIRAARDPGAPVRPNRVLWTVLGAGFGLLLGLSLALFRDWLDDTVTEPRDVERHVGAPVLATIVSVGTGADGTADRVAADQPRSPVTEAFRALRTSIEFTGRGGDGARTILVSSSAPREGKTTVALNLAQVLAQDHKRTLLVDADLRKPRLHAVFGADGRVGLSNVLAGRATLDDAIVPTNVENLFLLPAGPIPPNPAELLGRPAAADTFAALAARFDRIVVDTPPVGVVTDAVVLARLVGQVLLVVSSGTTKKRAAEHGASVLRSVGLEPSGVVLNQVRHGARWLYAGYYSAGEAGDGGREGPRA